jgi:hypothetical protein
MRDARQGMHVQADQPNLSWYLRRSREANVTPRCPFASVERCPRYYQSLSLLGGAGSTKIERREDDRLFELWKSSDLWPRTREAATSISGGGRSNCYAQFCPEVSYERFGVFATTLADFGDEIDRDVTHQQLSLSREPAGSWRWRWAGLDPMHFTECPIYSPLVHRPGLKSPGDGTKPSEMVTLKPALWGMSVDLKEVWGRAKKWIRQWRGRPAS